MLLISDNFLASDFIAENELPPLLEAAEQAGVLIMPVLISPSRFTRTPSLAQFQATNNPEHTLDEMKPAQWKRVLVELSDTIEEALSLNFP